MSTWRDAAADGIGAGVEIWAVALDDDLPGGEVSLLSGEEVGRAGRIRSELDRRRYVTSRLWLRHLLGDHLGLAPAEVSYRTGSNGKPELAPPSPLRFSVSRSGGVALYALSCGREVGVDVEEHSAQADLSAMERRFLSAAEREELGRLDGAARAAAFFRFWARKEAFLKGLGVGLDAPWALVDTTGEVVRFEGTAAAFPDGSVAWSVRDLDVTPAHAAAVSVEGDLAAAVPVRWLGVRPA
ncbi:MAG: 4'-phosphopantetheinyl transferase family protein [Acidimicrobiales bacterium]